MSLNSFDYIHIPQSLGLLRKLRYLNMYFVGFEGDIPSKLENLSSLRYLDLSGNQLQGSIPSSLGYLSALQ